MKTTVEFLDAVKSRHGFTSDYQLSKYLDCTRGGISSYRTGRTFLDEDMAYKVATDLDLEPGYVMACIASERAKSPEVKAAWKHTAELLYGIAATVVMVAFFHSAPDGASLMLVGFTAPFSIRKDCILCQTPDLFLWWAFLPLFLVVLSAHLPRNKHRPS